MKAMVQDRYGSADVFEFRDVDMPTLDEDRVMVRVRAVGLNPLDWHFMRGEPYVMRLSSGLRRPKRRTPGADVAGVVEAVAPGVTQFSPGDEVYGEAKNGCAEYMAVRHRFLAPKPHNLSFEEAAALPVAGLTALQGLRKGGIQAGQRVLVNGASGGVGHLAVQIAKHSGAEVTGVCSGHNLELVRAMGADHVIDYTTTDFTDTGDVYDMILDCVGVRPFGELRRVLRPRGSLVLVGGPKGRWIAPLKPVVKAAFLNPFVSHRLITFLAKTNQEDLGRLTELAEAGLLKPFIDRTYPLDETAEGIRYLERGHARGKVVITI